MKNIHLNETLYFDTPPRRWIEGLPLGNGKIGAMVMGYVAQERICLNHENIWRKIADRRTMPVAHHLHEIRRLILEGEWEKGARLLEKKLQPFNADSRTAMEEYQPACDLILEMNYLLPAEEYMRTLDLAKGIAKVTYRIGAVEYEKICFVSAVDDIFVMHLKSNRKKAISSTIWFEREADADCKLSYRANRNYLGLKTDIKDGTSFDG